MFLYTVLAAIAGLVFGILLATRTKMTEGIAYGKLDKAGRVVNVVLLAVYACLSPFYMFIGMICSAEQKGFLGLLGWIISIICASAALFCGVGLGASVALRKKGKSALSFAVQFIGVVAIALTFSLYAAFVGSLISPLN